MSAPSNRAYWVVAPGQGELRPMSDEGVEPCSLRAAFSGISSGTERLVGRGQVPAELHAHMACPGMAGTFPFPVKYGYSWVGYEADGSPIFTMHPHQEHIHAAAPIVPLPRPLSLPRATLLPNLETALNAWWDATLSEEEVPAIVGGGIVGVLLAFVHWKLRAQAPTVIERDPARRATLAHLPWIDVSAPADLGSDRWPVIFHASATGSGLQQSIDHLAFEGRVMELSWYGDQTVSLELGTTFHYERKRIIASQVSTLAPHFRGPRGAEERLSQVLEFLTDENLDRLLGPFIPFAELPEAMARLYRGEHLGLHPIVTYCTQP